MFYMNLSVSKIIFHVLSQTKISFLDDYIVKCKKSALYTTGHAGLPILIHLSIFLFA